MEYDDQISIKRRHYSSYKIDEIYRRVKLPKKTIPGQVAAGCMCTKARAWSILVTVFPCIAFLSKYKVEHLKGDLIGGLTIALLQIPQSIGLAALAGLRPEHGLYTAFFPAIIYLIFGTSPHISLGTNAILTILTRNIIEREVGAIINSKNLINTTSDAFDNVHNSTNYTDTYLSTESSTTMFWGHTTREATEHASSQTNISATTMLTTFQSVSISEVDVVHLRVEVAVTASLLTGIILSGLGIFQFGWLSKLMSTSFIGGFTTALAFHTASLEVPTMLGIHVPYHRGPAKLVKLYIDLFTNIKTTIIADLVIALVTIAILLPARILADRLKQRFKFPLPVEVLVISIGIIASYFGKLEDKYNATVLGEIVTGFQMPMVPSFNRASNMIMDCLVIAMLSYIISVSMARISADKETKNFIDSNQELLVHGIGNVVSSFFLCMPQSTSSQRSMLLKYSDSKTTFNGIIVGVVMTITILWIGNIFNALPMPMVGAIIVVSLKDLFVQFVDLPTYWRINKFDFLTWIITFLTALFADLEYGLLSGIAFSIISVVFQHQLAKGQIIGYSNQEDVFIEAKNRMHVKEFPSVKVFLFEAPVYFANAEIFRKQIFRQVLNPKDIIQSQHGPMKNEQNRSGDQTEIANEEDACNMDDPLHKLKHIVIDCKMITHIDTSGVQVLREIIQEYETINVKVYLANCSTKIRDTLYSAKFFDTFPKAYLFHDVVDAIYFINRALIESPEQSTIIMDEVTKL